jgi:DNA-binding MarR family transcriptional regulator
LRSHPGSHRFDLEEIGAGRYDAAQASVSRAARRLEARGLVERYVGAVSRWAGLRLTVAGFEAAPVLDHRQMVKTVAGLPLS